MTIPRLTLLLLNTTCPVLAKCVDPKSVANSAGPDQLASSEANWSGPALFVIKYGSFYKKPGSSDRIGGKLEVGVAFKFIQQGKGKDQLLKSQSKTGFSHFSIFNIKSTPLIRWHLDSTKVFLIAEFNCIRRRFCIRTTEPKHTTEYTLRKHAYSNIMKILQPKKDNFQIIFFFIFLLKT